MIGGAEDQTQGFATSFPVTYLSGSFPDAGICFSCVLNAYDRLLQVVSKFDLSTKEGRPYVSLERPNVGTARRESSRIMDCSLE
jgi:hypothetical protein